MVTVILVGVFLTLFVAEKVCRGAVRHKALPERPLDTYLPEQVQKKNTFEDFVVKREIISVVTLDFFRAEGDFDTVKLLSAKHESKD